LVAALEWYSNDFQKRTEIKTHFNTRLSELQLSDKTAIGLFRIFQESLTNVARHAKATTVNAALEIENDQLLLTIQDDGRGFDPEANDARRTLGLLGMKERALMMRGQYDIKSTPGKGTVIKVVVPVNNGEVLPSE
jgi:signal transduction histidine kinase